jgi:hypothetical protein
MPSILCWNTHSFVSKHDQLQYFLTHHPDPPLVICLAETFHDTPPALVHYTAHSFSHTYSIKKAQRTGTRSNSGGCIVYTHNDLPVTPLPAISVFRPDNESPTSLVWFKLRLPSSPSHLLLGFCYLQPNTSDAELHDFNCSVDNALALHLPVLLLGDMNARHAEWSPGAPNSQGRTIKTLIDTHNFTLLNSVYAPFQPTFRSGSVLDLALTNDPTVSSFQILSHVGLDSDHEPILVSFPDSAAKDPNNKAHTKWRTEKADWKKYQEALDSGIDVLRPLLPALSVDCTAPAEIADRVGKAIETLLHDAATTAIGKKTIRPNSKYWWKHASIKPAYDRYRAAVKKKNRIPAGLRTDTDLSEFRQARQQWRNTVRKAKRDSWDQCCQKISDPANGKLRWPQFKRTKKSEHSSVFSVRSSAADPSSAPLPATPTEGINNLAKYFHSIFDAPIDTSNVDKDIHEQIEQFARHLPDRPSLPSSLSAMHDSPFTIGSVRDACRYIRATTAAGPDDIHPLFLQHATDKFVSLFHELLQFTWAHGVIPRQWKLAKCIALYKGKKLPRSEPNSYRMISITSVLARTAERLVKRKLVDVLSNQNFFYKNQFGFRKSHATYDNLLLLSDRISQALSRKKSVPVAFLDFSKAFDTVWHPALLHKLYHQARVTGRLFFWIVAFLSDRFFFLVSGSLSSVHFNIKRGVPQGCVLSPILFLVFINDLSNCCSRFRCIALLFADDVAIYPIDDTATSFRDLQRALDVVGQWAYNKQMKFNKDKSNIVVFSNKAKPPSVPTFRLTNFVMSKVDSYDYMGVIFQANFRFDLQYEKIKTKINGSTHLISRLIKFHRPPTAQTILALTTSIVLPQITYSMPFVRYNGQQIKSLQSIFLAPLRMVLGLPFCAAAVSVFREFNLLELRTMYDLCLLRTAHRFASSPVDHSVHSHFQSLYANPIQKQTFCRSWTAVLRDAETRLSIRHSIPPHLVKRLLKARAFASFCSVIGGGLSAVKTAASIDSYLFSEPKLAATHRARLRFDLAKNHHSQIQRHIRPAQQHACGRCPASFLQPEPPLDSRQHVLLECTQHQIRQAREACSRALSSIDVPLSLSVLLGSISAYSAPKQKKILEITGIFILHTAKLQRI